MFHSCKICPASPPLIATKIFDRELAIFRRPGGLVALCSQGTRSSCNQNSSQTSTSRRQLKKLTPVNAKALTFHCALHNYMTEDLSRRGHLSLPRGAAGYISEFVAAATFSEACLLQMNESKTLRVSKHVHKGVATTYTIVKRLISATQPYPCRL